VHSSSALAAFEALAINDYIKHRRCVISPSAAQRLTQRSRIRGSCARRHVAQPNQPLGEYRRRRSSTSDRDIGDDFAFGHETRPVPAHVRGQRRKIVQSSGRR